MGIAYLLIAALVVVILAGTAVLVHGVLLPPRKTLGVAMAHLLPLDPQMLDLSFNERTFVLPDGTTTTGWDMRGGDDIGPIVIFTHGWGDSRFGALTWVPLVASCASRVVVYDVRGHGDSPAVISRLGTNEAWDLLAVMDQLNSRDPAPDGTQQPVVLFGHSMGAGIAIAAAAIDAQHETHRVHGVIADGANCTFNQPVAGQLRERKLPTFPFVMLAQCFLALILGGVWRGFDRATLASQLRCPLLLLHGSDDPICPLHEARQIAAAAIEARLVVFEGGAHSNLAQVDQRRYRASVEQFVRYTCGMPSV